jgi:S1-C subfamily serine protease
MRHRLSPWTPLFAATAVLAASPAALAGEQAAPLAERHVVVVASDAPVAPGMPTTRVEMRVDGNVVGYHRDPVPDHGWLGVLLGPADRGVEVLAVAGGSPAERAGLQAGDVITGLDGADFSDVGALVGALKDRGPGDRVRVEATRDGRDRTFRVRLAEQPTDVAFEMPEGRELPPGLAPMPVPPVPLMPAMPGHDVDVLRLAPTGRPRLGVQLAALTEQLALYFGVEPGRGVLVQAVVPDTPAQRAGLEAGDVLLAVGRTEVTAAGDVTRALAELGDGDHVTLDVLRRGASLSVEAVLDTPRPEAGDQGALRRIRLPAQRIAVVQGAEGAEPVTLDVAASVTDALRGLDEDELRAAGLDQAKIDEIVAGLAEGGTGEKVIAIVRRGEGAEPQVHVAVAGAAEGEPHALVFHGEDGSHEMVEAGEAFGWTVAGQGPAGVGTLTLGGEDGDGRDVRVKVLRVGPEGVGAGAAWPGVGAGGAWVL